MLKRPFPALLLLFLPLPARAAVWYVSPRGTAAGGTSWATAYNKVAAALAAARDGDEVWVAAGVYEERVTLRSGVKLYGGFTGNETARGQRKPPIYLTVLDGGHFGAVVTIQNGTAASTVLDGFTLSNDLQNNGNPSSVANGVNVLGGSPTISHNLIRGNVIGIECGKGAQPVIAGNVITNNLGSPFTNGGIVCTNAAPWIMGNTIVANGRAHPTTSAAQTALGGALSAGGSAAVLMNNIIAFNEDGLFGDAASRLTLGNNCVYGNGNADYTGIPNPTGQDGNIQADPRLANAAFGNLHIQPNSPCRDAGESTAAAAADVDIDGQPRFLGSRVDIGADESDGRLWKSNPIVVRVRPDGSDALDGSSWAAAKKTVQAGVDAAAKTGGEVWVAEGVYVENVLLRPYAWMYGGFAGTESRREDRHPERHATVLDGYGRGPVITTMSGFRLSGVDGFTIRNGHSLQVFASGQVAYGGGAGVACGNASPIVANNFIVKNIGAGAGCTGGSPVFLHNLVAGNNIAGAGSEAGGVDAQGGAPIIAGNVIVANSASGQNFHYSGAVKCDGGGAVVVNNVIKGNTAYNDLDYAVSCAAPATIANNTILGNGGFGLVAGAGVLVVNNIVAYNDSGIFATTPVSHNCVFGNADGDYVLLSGTPVDQTGTTGNIKADPQFASTVYGDTRLQPASPCRDAGDDNVLAAVPYGTQDVDGLPRKLGTHTDIGASETDGSLWPSEATVLHVRPDGSDAADGLTWAAAKRTVQEGISALLRRGGEVWVAGGVYNEPVQFGTFTSLYGGFAGTETERGQRDVRANATTLDGQRRAWTVKATGGFVPNVVDGFTIRGGLAYGGGGVYANSSHVIIAHNLITGNVSYYEGGGICMDDSEATAEYNVITGNTAALGAGINVIEGAGRVVGNLIVNNAAVVTHYGPGNGGGISCLNGATPLIANNTIAGNTSAHAGGGIYAAAPATLTNNIVAFNSSGLFGTATAPPVLLHNDVYGNSGMDYNGIPPGLGDIGADPLFLDAMHGDFHLMPVSPCVNAGDSSVATPGETDLDGHPRIMGSAVDIGAYETAALGNGGVAAGGTPPKAAPLVRF